MSQVLTLITWGSLLLAALVITMLPAIARHAQDEGQRAWRDAFHIEDFVLLGLVLVGFAALLKHFVF